MDDRNDKMRTSEDEAIRETLLKLKRKWCERQPDDGPLVWSQDMIDRELEKLDGTTRGCEMDG